MRPKLHPFPTADSWWAPEPIDAVYTALTKQETEILRLAQLDKFLSVKVMGAPWPLDRLSNPHERMGALEAHLHERTVLLGQGALWVHCGGTPPEFIYASSPMRIGGRARTHLQRVVLAEIDVIDIGSRRCATVERAAVDLARTAPPVTAVQAILRARAYGCTAYALLSALERCRGGCSVGKPRARQIIAAVYS